MSSEDLKKTEKDVESFSVEGSDSLEAEIAAQLKLEDGHTIQYRTCSWQKTAALLFSEYICLAILSFPWSYSVLGLVPGILVTIAVALSVLYTSLILWKFCLKHPEVRDVCDVGRILFGGSQWAYNATAAMFIMNNTLIAGLHCVVGAKLLNTLSNSARCTIIFSMVSAIACFVVSLPRTLSQMSGMGIFSAVTMGISVLLAIVFAGVQGKPEGWTEELGDPIMDIVGSGRTYVLGMSAFLNISYTFIGQITLPSFIAEMKNPKDFPKALWAVTICEIVVFTLCGSLMYYFIGNQYMTAPAYSSLTPTYKKIAFSFALPTIIYLGSLYSSVSARFIFFRLFGRGSRHRHENTALGWGVWAGILALTWIAAFVIAEIVPFFSDFLSLLCSLFSGWFGFIFWAVAYFRLTPKEQRWTGPLRIVETLLNYFWIALGVYIFTCGTYVSIQSIIDSYAKSLYGSVFSCASTAV